MTKSPTIVAILLASTALGCATSTKAPPTDWPWQATAVVQFCVANPASKDFYKFIHVNVHPDGRPASTGVTNAYPAGTTAAGQTVFEGYGTAPPARLRAILTYGQERQRYVYFPKPPVLEERWSEWQSADFQSEDYGFSQKLLYSGKYESQPASDNATKVRFRLKSFNQQRQDLDDYRKGIGREEIPPC